MDNNNINTFFNASLSNDDFNRLSKFIFEQIGIKMPPTKKVMLQGRLQKRLKELGIADFKTYIDYVFSNEGKNEIIHMFDAVSTNKTDFFRESNHFDFMSNNVLPEFYSQNKAGTIKIWSAACSSGEEPYTIAITLAEFIETHQNMNFSILGTDISTRILQMAHNAVYKEERVAVIPMAMKKKYLLKSKDRKNPTVKIKKELRNKIRFQRLNFMDNAYSSINETFDVVFCRNALIYFDRETQENVLNKLCGKLKQGGYLFIGHSESVMNMNLPIKQLKPTIFKKI